jgi:hypothetical protein
VDRSLSSPGEQTPEDPLESPEVLMINALLEDPQGFRPERYGVDKSMLASWSKAWAFCAEHQKSEGHAPSMELFQRRFPDFEILRGVKPNWAAELLRKTHRERTMRKDLRAAIDKINTGNVDEAQDLLRGLIRPSSVGRKGGLNTYDPAVVENEVHKIAYPTPWDSLTMLTNGGVGVGELWFLAARLTQGKSWMLPLYGVSMAEAGAEVAIMTAEMPAPSYVRRIHRMHARHNRMLQMQLRSPDKEARVAAVKALPSIPGKIDVYDPSHIEMSTRTIRSLAGDYQYVLVDHMGLMRGESGERAIEGWRMAAEISNITKEITLEQRVGIIGAVQVNREGDSEGFIPPKVRQLAGADDLGRDADVIIPMRRMGERSMLHDVPKNRDGVSGRFYTTFEPDTAQFIEISKDQALARAREDQDRIENR